MLDGTKILKEAWGENVLVPLYDNEDSVCGILYNDTPYFFLKNLQGDVIAVLDKNNQTVARYVYDAWGSKAKTVDNCFWRSETAENVRSTFGKQGVEGAICD